MVTPDLSVGVIIAIVVGAVVVCVLICTAYFIFNREDFFIDSKRNSKSYEYTELHDFDSKISKHEIQPIRGILAGLENTDQKCYMNSIVQALASSKKIFDQLKEAQSYIPFCKSVKILQELVEGLNDDSPNRSIENNTALLKELVKAIKWSVTPERDAYDFLSALVNDIQNELIDAKVEKNAPLKFDIKYKYCGVKIPDSIKTHLGLSLELCGEYQRNPGVPLDFLIKKYFSKTLIDEDPTKSLQLFMCKRCPNVLVIHILANKWNNVLHKMVKPTYFIKYEEYLNINLDVLDFDNDEMSKENVEYKLTAVIHHKENQSTDHYVTYRQFQEDWFLIDDTKIDYITFNYNVPPYLLIYEKF